MALIYTADISTAARQSALTSSPHSPHFAKSAPVYTILAVATVAVVVASVVVKLRLSRTPQTL